MQPNRKMVGMLDVDGEEEEEKEEEEEGEREASLDQKRGKAPEGGRIHIEGKHMCWNCGSTPPF